MMFATVRAARMCDYCIVNITYGTEILYETHLDGLYTMAPGLLCLLPEDNERPAVLSIAF